MDAFDLIYLSLRTMKRQWYFQCVIHRSEFRTIKMNLFFVYIFIDMKICTFQFFLKQTVRVILYEYIV